MRRHDVARVCVGIESLRRTSRILGHKFLRPMLLSRSVFRQVARKVARGTGRRETGSKKGWLRIFLPALVHGAGK